MRRRKQRTPMAALDEINVTPLLDLTFLLLIAFMITMPLMEYGTSVNPPEMNGDALPEDNFVTVEVTKDNTYVIDKEVVSSEELSKRLRTLADKTPKPSVLVRGDGQQTYEGVLNLLKLVRNSGFKDAVLVTQAEGN